MRRGEAWLINLAPTVGAGIKKTRPAVIANDDAIEISKLEMNVHITDRRESW